MRRRIEAVALVPVLLISLLALGCIKTPAEKVAEARQQYTVQLNTWRVQQPEPILPEPEELEGEGEAAGEAVAMAAEAAMVAEEVVAEEADVMEEGGEEMMEEDLGPQPVGVLFDLLVYFSGREALPGVTLDVTHVDSSETEKGTYQQWIDTSGVSKGSPGQVTFVLEDILVEEGDAFSVEILPTVPAEARGQYREFAAAE